MLLLAFISILIFISISVFVALLIFPERKKSVNPPHTARHLIVAILVV